MSVGRLNVAQPGRRFSLEPTPEEHEEEIELANRWMLVDGEWVRRGPGRSGLLGGDSSDGDVPGTRRVDPRDLLGGLRDLRKHQGPGPHPGTGTDQSVHGRGGGASGPRNPLQQAEKQEANYGLTGEIARSRVQEHLHDDDRWADLDNMTHRDMVAKALTARRIAERMSDEDLDGLVDAFVGNKPVLVPTKDFPDVEDALPGTAFAGKGKANMAEVLRSDKGYLVYDHMGGSYQWWSDDDVADPKKAKYLDSPSFPDREVISLKDNPDRAREMLHRIGVSEAVRQWAKTSNDSSIESLGMQKLVEKEFSIAGVGWESFYTAGAGNEMRLRQDVNAWANRNEQGVRGFLRAMYNETQSELNRRNISSVTVHRGGVYPEGRVAPSGRFAYRPRPASSWSTSYGMARSFATKFKSHFNDETFRNHEAVILTTRAPADRILSMPSMGWGAYDESEVVLLSGRGGSDYVEGEVVGGFGPSTPEVGQWSQLAL